MHIKPVKACLAHWSRKSRISTIEKLKNRQRLKRAQSGSFRNNLFWISILHYRRPQNDPWGFHLATNLSSNVLRCFRNANVSMLSIRTQAWRARQFLGNPLETSADPCDCDCSFYWTRLRSTNFLVNIKVAKVLGGYVDSTALLFQDTEFLGTCADWQTSWTYFWLEHVLPFLISTNPLAGPYEDLWTIVIGYRHIIHLIVPHHASRARLLNYRDVRLCVVCAKVFVCVFVCVFMRLLPDE